VEAAFAGHDRFAIRPAAAVRELSRELYRRFVGFGAGVAEKDAIESGARRKLLCERGGRLMPEEIADMYELSGLLSDGGRYGRMRMSERAYGNAADAVQIAFAALVDKLAAFARDKRNGRSVVIL
jgi:hypothetical protein